jgi:hypothetical protein
MYRMPKWEAGQMEGREVVYRSATPSCLRGFVRAFHASALAPELWFTRRREDTKKPMMGGCGESPDMLP